MIPEVLNAVCGATESTSNIHIGLPADDVLEALDNERRREVIRRLAGAAGDDPAIPLGELAEYVAAVENGKPVEKVTSDERKKAYIGLYQAHLPTLEETGIIAVSESNLVRPVVDTQELAKLLEVIEDACEGDERP